VLSTKFFRELQEKDHLKKKKKKKKNIKKKKKKKKKIELLTNKFCIIRNCAGDVCKCVLCIDMRINRTSNCTIFFFLPYRKTSQTKKVLTQESY